ncbi:MAG: hypothetical protein U5L04_10545 [Trueperaceae bacterium]|nr:hypothetical protein [Trueperaceae bacterium]
MERSPNGKLDQDDSLAAAKARFLAAAHKPSRSPVESIIGHYPKRSLVAALVLGVAAGALPEVRKTLWNEAPKILKRLLS